MLRVAAGSYGAAANKEQAEQREKHQADATQRTSEASLKHPLNGNLSHVNRSPLEMGSQILTNGADNPCADRVGQTAADVANADENRVAAARAERACVQIQRAVRLRRGRASEHRTIQQVGIKSGETHRRRAESAEAVVLLRRWIALRRCEIKKD